MGDALLIPTNTGPDTTPQVVRVILDGTAWQIGLRFNGRAGMWRCDIANDSGTVLAAGLSLRNAGIPANGCIFGRAGFPPGLLLALASADPATDANAEELGARVLLAYAAATAA